MLGTHLGTGLAVCLLAVAAWPGVRLCAFRPFRHGMPVTAALLGGALIAYALAIAGVAFAAPAALPVFAALAAGAVGIQAWRSRAAYGTARGWPPGSLSLAPFASASDQRFLFEQARRHGPIFKTGATFPHLTWRPMACVVGHAAGLELLRQHGDALASGPAAAYSRFIPRGALRYMAPDDHAVYRRILASTVSPDLIRSHAAEMAQATHDALLRMAQDCEAGGSVGIEPRPHIDAMLFRVLARMFFGIADDDRDFERLRSLYREIAVTQVTALSPRRRVQRALGQIATLLRRRHAQPGDAGGNFLAAAVRAQPALLDDSTFLGNMIFMLDAARNDVGGLLVWLLKVLGDHPQWTARLRAACAGAAEPADDLADRIVAETLRLQQSEYLYRRVLRDIRFRGFTIPKGWLLRIGIWEGHRDSRAFADPDAFDPDRTLAPDYVRANYAPFGLHGGTCIGVALTHAIARTFISQLAAGFDWSVAADGPPAYGRFHWQPSPRFRIRVSPRH